MRGALGIVHVPKCAGTSLRRELDAMVDLAPMPKYHDPYGNGVEEGARWAGPVDESTYSISELSEAGRKYAVVMGHVTTRSYVEAGFGSVRIIVREPRARILSMFDHWIRMDERTYQDLGESGATLKASVSGSLADFLESDSIGPPASNMICRMLVPGTADWPGFTRMVGVYDPVQVAGVIDAELEAVRPQVAGVHWSDDLDGIISSIAKQLGVRSSTGDRIAASRDNVSPPSTRDEVITPSMMARLDELTRLDSLVIKWYMDRGLLAERSPGDLERDFESTATAHGFTVG
jgi:hypothetical protein